MANTKVDICNMALRHLSNETIDNFDTEPTRPSRHRLAGSSTSRPSSTF
jgi:hypothetical protein